MNDPIQPAASPSSTEAATTTSSSTTTGTSSEEGSFDFGALATHDEMADTNAEVPVTSSEPTATPTSTQAAAPASIPQAPAPGQTTPVVAGNPPAATPAAAPASPQVQPVAAPAAPVTPTATEGAQPQGTSPEPISFEKHKATFMPQLEALYKIPEADIEGLRTNPEVYLPKLAAQLHYEVQLAAFNSVLTAMPDLVSMVMDQRTNVAEANTKFYDKWPALKQHIAANPQAEEAVRQSINAYRNANPKASQDDIITRAGLLAMVSLGIPLEQMLPQATAPAAPQAPVVRPTPHRPVGMGAVGHVPNHPAAGGSEGNIFEQLAEAHMQGNI